MIRWLALGISMLLSQPTGAAQSEQAVKAHNRALRLLAEGDAKGAEASAREALAASARFAPEEEITEAPEKGLLFEDVIAEARAKYRRRRGQYFLTLGEALTGQQRWMEARKALRRASQLSTSAKPLLVIASHPDLPPAEQINALLAAFFSTGVDQGAVGLELVETGVFPDRNSMQALIDQRRLMEEVVPDYPDLVAEVSALPELRSATDRGTFVSTDYLRTGAILVLYFPTDGCGRCSEALDGINRAVSDAGKEGKQILPVALVNEPDLGAARRIARLLALRLEVGRSDRLPAEISPGSEGEIRIVTRNGLLQVIIPLVDRLRSDEIRRRMKDVLDRLETFEEGELTGPDGAVEEVARLEQLGRSREALLSAIELGQRREAGPGSVQSLYRLIDKVSQSVLLGMDSPVEIFDLLEILSRLRGAGEAKSRFLNALDEGYGQKLLEAVQSIEQGISRQAPAGRGVFELAVSSTKDDGGARRISLRRSFPGGTSLRHFNFVLESSSAGMRVLWLAPELEIPLGVRYTSKGAVFLFEESRGCRGLELIGDEGVVYEGCPARLVDGDIVEEHLVLVDAVADVTGPRYYRRGRIDNGTLVGGDNALERGLRLFEEGKFESASRAFEEAAGEIDPVAPYDEVDLRYNQARCLEARGKIREALTLFETIGDVAYQDLVDERIHILSSGGRR